jgi:ADP-heptose:LPS heptosyltransferase
MKTRKITELIWLPTGGHIGDAILIVSIFGEAISKNPGLHISYVMRRNASAARELSAAYPEISVVHLANSPLLALQRMVPLLKKRAVVMLPPPRDTHPLIVKVLGFIFMLRGSTVISFDDQSAWLPSTDKIVYEKKKRYIDNLRRALSLGHIATLPENSPPHLNLITSVPEQFPFKDTPYIVIHPFPHMSTRKTMPLRRWKDLVSIIKQKYPTYSIVITGAEVDRNQAEEIQKLYPEKMFLGIDLSLQQVAGILKKAALYIGVDTGPSHLAGVLHVQSIILSQQNDPVWLPDYNPNALLIWEKKNCVCGIPGKTCEVIEDGQPYRRCVYDISDEAITNAIEKKLGHYA